MKEQDIIHGCKNREETAYKALVETYSSYLFAICKRYMTDTEKARDCLQESLIQIISKIDRYEERGKFKSWMGTLTVKKCLDQLRKEKRFDHRNIEDVKEPSQQETVSYQLEKQDVMKFLDGLPDHYRIAINMFLVEGYSHREIGEVLSISESSSRSLVSRARKMILNAFKEKQGEDASTFSEQFKLKIIRS